MKILDLNVIINSSSFKVNLANTAKTLVSLKSIDKTKITLIVLVLGSQIILYRRAHI